MAAAWEPAEGTTFMVRSLNYMRTKIKEPSGPCMYRCAGGRAGAGRRCQARGHRAAVPCAAAPAVCLCGGRTRRRHGGAAVLCGVSWRRRLLGCWAGS